MDTAGIDDSTELGELRLEKTLQVIPRCDVAILIIDADGLTDYEKTLIEKFGEFNIPYQIVINKYDISQIQSEKYNELLDYTNIIIETSSINDKNIVDKFVESIIKILPDEFINPPSILGDKVTKEDLVILVTPIDKEAPKGRLILPEVQTIRDLLDNDCMALVIQENNLEKALNLLTVKPKLVVTDSQSLEENDRVLILESCTHHTIEDDIAREKIPKLLQKKLGFNLKFEYKSGHDFPSISGYKLIIHCGACMTNRKEILSRILIANKKNIPITNYGMVISYCLGILDRAVKIFDCE